MFDNDNVFTFLALNKLMLMTQAIIIIIWFRHYATSQKVAGSIIDEVIGLFN
jgi:hypothetical protein